MIKYRVNYQNNKKKMHHAPMIKRQKLSQRKYNLLIDIFYTKIIEHEKIGNIHRDIEGDK